MSDIQLNIEVPLDSQGFLRRQCPLCNMEFKIKVDEKELTDLITSGISSYLIIEEDSEDTKEEETTELFCPYCSQESDVNEFWTEEQNAYFNIYAENILADLVNDNFIRPMKREFKKPSSGPIGITIEADEMKKKEPWISPEDDDMDVHSLSCCGKELKLLETWDKEYACIYCGFKHLI